MGRNYTSLLNMIRGAGSEGCSVTVIRTVHQISDNIIKPEYESKYVEKYYYSIEPDREALIELLIEHCIDDNEKVVLLPTDDFTASTIDLFMDRLQPFFLFPNINYQKGEVVKLMNKNNQKRFAKTAGMNISEGWTVKIEKGLYAIPDDICFPCFPKPETSFLGNKKCMVKCNDYEELNSVISAVAKNGDCPLLIEEYHKIDKEFCVLGYVNRNKAVLPCIVEKIVIGNGAHKGVTMIGNVKSLRYSYPEIYKKLCSFLEAFEFHGLVDIDLYESEGKIYFNEMNLRMGAFGFAAFCAGYNLPSFFIREVAGLPVPGELKEMNSEITCISEKVNLDDYCDGYCSLREYKMRLKEVPFHFIQYSEDQRPYAYFKKIERIKILKRIIKNLLRI